MNRPGAAEQTVCGHLVALACALRRSAQYLRIRSAAAFLAAALMPLRLCTTRAFLLPSFLIFAQRAFCAAAIATV